MFNFKSYAKNRIILHKTSPLKVIDTHPFNKNIEIITYQEKKIKESEKKNNIATYTYYKFNNIKIYKLLTIPFLSSISYSITLYHEYCQYNNDILLLKLNKLQYESFGLLGQESYFKMNKDYIYIIKINIKELHQNEKKYERFIHCMSKLDSFNTILGVLPLSITNIIWPNNIKDSIETIQTSLTIDKSFNQNDYNNFNIIKPISFQYSSDLITFLGLLKHELFDLLKEQYTQDNEYLRPNYQPFMNDQYQTIPLDHIQYLHINNHLIHNDSIHQLITYYQNLNLSLVIIQIDGYDDVIESWNNKQHEIVFNGDNSYIILLEKDQDIKIYKLVSGMDQNF